MRLLLFPAQYGATTTPAPTTDTLATPALRPQYDHIIYDMPPYSSNCYAGMAVMGGEWIYM